MKKYFLLTLVLGMLLINSVFAFPPPSPDQEERANKQVELCESTGGIANKTYSGGYDPKTGIDRAWGVFVRCDCPTGLSWNTTAGCVRTEAIPPISTQSQNNETQKQDNTKLYFGVSVLIILLVAILWVLRKK